jgi:hypothetical protein
VGSLDDRLVAAVAVRGSSMRDIGLLGS